jgi:hypothetical protein
MASKVAEPSFLFDWPCMLDQYAVPSQYADSHCCACLCPCPPFTAVPSSAAHSFTHMHLPTAPPTCIYPLKRSSQAHIFVVVHHSACMHICANFHCWFWALQWVKYQGWNNTPFSHMFYSGTPLHTHSQGSPTRLVKKKWNNYLNFYVCFAYINQPIYFQDCFIF